MTESVFHQTHQGDTHRQLCWGRGKRERERELQFIGDGGKGPAAKAHAMRIYYNIRQVLERRDIYGPQVSAILLQHSGIAHKCLSTEFFKVEVRHGFPEML